MASPDKLEQLERRVSAVVQRIGDPTVTERVGRALLSGDATDLFALLVDEDRRVRDAAHECALLRYAYVAAIAAAAMGFDADNRDELVQRTFMTLPQAVARAKERGMSIPHPVGWLRRRAYLIGRQIMREDRGASEDESSIDHGALSPEDAMLDALDTHRAELALASALEVLASERPLWADILRLHYLEGCQLDDIAQRLGRAHGTIRNLAHDARLRLGEIIRTQFPHLAGSPEAITIESRRPRVIR